MLWVPLNMGMSAAHCQGNVREFQSVWRVVTLCWSHWHCGAIQYKCGSVLVCCDACVCLQWGWQCYGSRCEWHSPACWPRWTFCSSCQYWSSPCSHRRSENAGAEEGANDAKTSLASTVEAFPSKILGVLSSLCIFRIKFMQFMFFFAMISGA